MTSLTADPKLREKAELKMKTWLHIVARTKTIPKEFVCGEDCEQHSIYGRLFDGHPLNHVKSESPISQISPCWMWILCEIKRKLFFSNFGLGINLPSASQCLKAPRKKRKISPSMRFPPKFWRQKSRVRLYAHWAGVTLRYAYAYTLLHALSQWPTLIHTKEEFLIKLFAFWF